MMLNEHKKYKIDSTDVALHICSYLFMMNVRWKVNTNTYYCRFYALGHKSRSSVSNSYHEGSDGIGCYFGGYNLQLPGG